MNIRKLIYLLGEKIRNPLIREKYNELLHSDFASYEWLVSQQEIKLKKLLDHAIKYSPYYREKLKHLNLNNFSINDLQSIPILTKKDLKENFQMILNNPFNEKLIKSETSGSTGEALIFYRNLEWDAVHRAAQYRGYSWYNINPWDKNLYFWGFNPNWKQKIKIRMLDFLLNRYRIFSFDEKEIKKAEMFLRKSKYVEGYSSAIYELSQKFLEQKKYFNNIQFLKGTSEKIYSHYHEITKKVFGKKIVSEYGAAEAGIIAFECPYGNMHITMENVIVEEINSKIIVTNLYSYSFPIIRYELGDYIKLSNKKCKCGREHLIIEEITGRIGKKIRGYEKNYPSLTLYYIFKNIAINYKLELTYFGNQYQQGKLVLNILDTEEFSKEKIIKLIKEEAYKYFKNDIELTINFINKLPRKNKKIKDFESFIKD